MCSLPPFLQPILALRGTWESILEFLYDIFERDFVQNVLLMGTMKIVFDRKIGDEGKMNGFWHLITKKMEEGDRLYDPRRAERLHWNRPTIEHHDNPIIREFDYLEGNGTIRRYLWIESCDFCVVLEPKEEKHLCILITAFYVDHPYKRTLNKKYQKRIRT